ncbi:MAG TPA: phosphate/phosphite/phosphonate ABC transporter substrate-binding protein [Phycisphaerae bacterium]|nr:phosphate/phosphite/phosphonate ABC transporter substrate-binding protein [Phycisphaerae bacterium]
MITSRRFLLAFAALAAIFAALAWLAHFPTADVPTASAPAPVPAIRFRLGLIPERNLYEQRRAFRALADYLDSHVNPKSRLSTLDTGPSLHVELVTSSNYAGILHDFAHNDIDGAFLGSLVAVLAVDRSGAQVLVKSESHSGKDTYAGTLFVPPDSPIHSLADLRGKKIAAVRTTNAGSIFPLFAFQQAGIDRANEPQLLWSGTHDDVIEEVFAHRVDAGAVKDLRLDSWEQEHPGQNFRRLATGPRAPESALVVTRDLPPDLRDALAATLLQMNRDPQAAPVLQALQLNRFVPCDISEYTPLYDMLDAIAPRWSETGVDGPPPLRPQVLTAATTAPNGGR